MVQLRYTHMFRILCVLQTVGCVPLDPAFEAPEGALSGCLTLDNGGAPAQNVQIWVEGRFEETVTQTDEEGRFKFDKLPEGRVSLVAQLGNGLGWSTTATVAGGRSRTMSCAPMSATACLSGTVQYDRGTSQPVEVMVGDTARWAWTGADGTFNIQVPASRCYQTTLRAINLHDRVEELCAGEPGAPCNPERTLLSMQPLDEPEPRVWKRMPDLPVPVADPAVAIDGTTLYVASGHSCPTGSECAGVHFGHGQTKAFQLFEFRKGEWQSRTRVKTPRSAASAAILNGEYYLIGGYRVDPSRCDLDGESPQCFPHYMTQVEIYNPLSKTWREGIRLERARAWSTAVASTGAIHVIGGVDGYTSRYHDKIEIFTPGIDEWIGHPAALTLGSYQHLSCVNGRRIFSFGGQKHKKLASGEQPDPGGVPNDDIRRLCAQRLLTFDFNTTTWGKQGTPAPIHRESGDCVILGEYLYAPGYKNDAASHEPSLRYDIRKGVWTQLPVSPSEGSRFKVVATPHGLVIVGGGSLFTNSRPEVYASVATRFLDRASSLYATGDTLEAQPSDPRPESVFPEDLDALCLELD